MNSNIIIGIILFLVVGIYGLTIVNDLIVNQYSADEIDVWEILDLSYGSNDATYEVNELTSCYYLDDTEFIGEEDGYLNQNFAVTGYYTGDGTLTMPDETILYDQANVLLNGNVLFQIDGSIEASYLVDESDIQNGTNELTFSRYSLSETYDLTTFGDEWEFTNETGGYYYNTTDGLILDQVVACESKNEPIIKMEYIYANTSLDEMFTNYYRTSYSMGINFSDYTLTNNNKTTLGLYLAWLSDDPVFSSGTIGCMITINADDTYNLTALTDVESNTTTITDTVGTLTFVYDHEDYSYECSFGGETVTGTSSEMNENATTGSFFYQSQLYADNSPGTPIDNGCGAYNFTVSVMALTFLPVFEPSSNFTLEVPSAQLRDCSALNGDVVLEEDIAHPNEEGYYVVFYNYLTEEVQGITATIVALLPIFLGIVILGWLGNKIQ